MSQSIFYDAGKFLAKHILGLLPRVDEVSLKMLVVYCISFISLLLLKTLLDAPGGMRVVCVGSVFKSWKHLKEGESSIQKLTFHFT